MSATVTPLRADVSMSATKQMLLDTVAEQFDQLAASQGEPIGIVFGLVDADGGGGTAYHIVGQNGRDAMYVARAAHLIQCDAIGWMRPHG